MPTKTEKLNKARQLLSIMDEEKLTKLRKFLLDIENQDIRREFSGHFKQVIDFISKVKEKNRTDFENFNKLVSDLAGKLEGNNSKELESVKSELNQLGSSLSQIVDEKLSQIRNGVDADEDRVSIIASERALEAVKPLIPTIDTPEQIADKLEALKDDNRLKISAIDKLREELDELKSRPIGGRGGARKVVYTKRINLSSQCNGTLKEFTMPKDCIDVLAVYGTQFPITFDEADFTFEGQTLTLTSEVGAPQTGQTLFALIQTLFYGKI